MARSLPDIPPLRVVKQIFPGATLRCGDASLTELLRQASRGLIDIPTAGPRAKLKFFDEIRERGGIPEAEDRSSAASKPPSSRTRRTSESWA